VSPPDVVAAWSVVRQIFDDVYFDGEPVPARDFDAFEARTGLSLPPDLRGVLGLARGGLELTDVGIALHSWPPLTAADHGLPELPPDMPPELRLIGGDLGDDVWAVWLPRLGRAEDPTPVVVIRDHNIEDLVPFDTVLPFLAVATVAGLLDPLFDEDADTNEALDALGVPDHLRSEEMPERELLDAVAVWATDGREQHHWWRKEGTSISGVAEGVRRG
jgi:hypothetical protein